MVSVVVPVGLGNWNAGHQKKPLAVELVLQILLLLLYLVKDAIVFVP